MSQQSPFASAASWQQLLSLIGNKKQYVWVHSMLQRHFGCSSAVSQMHWAKLTTKYPLLDSHTLKCASRTMMSVERAGIVLAYINPGIRKLAPDGWKMWGEPDDTMQLEAGHQAGPSAPLSHSGLPRSVEKKDSSSSANSAEAARTGKEEKSPGQGLSPPVEQKRLLASKEKDTEPLSAMDTADDANEDASGISEPVSGSGSGSGRSSGQKSESRKFNPVNSILASMKAANGSSSVSSSIPKPPKGAPVSGQPKASQAVPQMTRTYYAVLGTEGIADSIRVAMTKLVQSADQKALAEIETLIEGWAFATQLGEVAKQLAGPSEEKIVALVSKSDPARMDATILSVALCANVIPPPHTDDVFKASSEGLHKRLTALLRAHILTWCTTLALLGALHKNISSISAVDIPCRFLYLIEASHAVVLALKDCIPDGSIEDTIREIEDARASYRHIATSVPALIAASKLPASSFTPFDPLAWRTELNAAWQKKLHAAVLRQGAV